ncbi:MAG: disulfide bond formation protein B [Pseudomonadota bacterium]
MIGVVSSLSFSERVLALSFIVSAISLTGAHLFERVGGLAPCILCLDQREAHWAALAVAAAGLAASRIFKSSSAAAAAVGAAALVYAVSAGLSFYHTGVEFKFWPGPAMCAGGGNVGPIDVGSISAALDGPVTAPACDDVQWTLLGVSMAGYNLLISSGLFALTLAAAIAETRRVKRGRYGALA